MRDMTSSYSCSSTFHNSLVLQTHASETVIPAAYHPNPHHIYIRFHSFFSCIYICPLFNIIHSLPLLYIGTSNIHMIFVFLSFFRVCALLQIYIASRCCSYSIIFILYCRRCSTSSRVSEYILSTLVQ